MEGLLGEHQWPVTVSLHPLLTQLSPASSPDLQPCVQDTSLRDEQADIEALHRELIGVSEEEDTVTKIDAAPKTTAKAPANAPAKAPATAAVKAPAKAPSGASGAKAPAPAAAPAAAAGAGSAEAYCEASLEPGAVSSKDATPSHLLPQGYTEHALTSSYAAGLVLAVDHAVSLPHTVLIQSDAGASIHRGLDQGPMCCDGSWGPGP